MAQVLTSISGIQISAASAGYSPTNSGDVSAIASAYQVVSSTATQLYAGTAFLTEVNSAPVSASRAGNAANASLANSAYYDGTGRLISALPDAAEVSSIASSYAESAASSKLDASAQVVTATAGDGTYVTSINGMGISGEGGVDSATVSAIASSYAESAVSSKADSSALSSYAKSADVSAAVNKVTSMSGNWNTTYDTVFYNSAYWTTGYTTVRDNSASWGGGVDSATVSAIASAYQVVSSTASGSGEIFGQTSYYATEINGLTLSAQEAALATYATNAGSAAAAPTNSSEVSAIASSYVESAVSSKQDSSAMSAYALSSNVSGVIDTVSANSATWGQGGVDSATVSSIASSYAESAVSSKLDSSASSSFYTTANESGYVDSAYVGSAVGSAVSSYQPLSGMSAYESSFSAGEGLEFVTSGDDRILQVEAPVDIVAGPGIVIDNPDGNTLRVSVAQSDETVLWDGEGTGSTSVSLSESILNFETVKIVYAGGERYGERLVAEIKPTSNISSYGIQLTDWFINSAGSFLVCAMGFYSVSNDGKTLSGDQIKHMWFSVPNMTYSGAGTSGVKLFKVIGCNRIASN